MEILYKNKNLEVSLQAPGLALPVYADPETLTLVVTNLLQSCVCKSYRFPRVWPHEERS